MAKLTDMTGRPLSGQLPWLVVGLVEDNVDPDNLARIKVKFPTLEDEPLSFWLRVASPNAGNERGFYALPEKGDEVLVAFMQGSQDVGLIMGQFWNGKDAVPTEHNGGLPGSGKTSVSGIKFGGDKFTDGSNAYNDNDLRFWKSRSGHLIIFDDTSGSESVQIWDKTHTLSIVLDSATNAIYMSNTKGDTHIQTKNDLYLEAGNDLFWSAGNNIEGYSKMDTKHVADMNYSLEAKKGKAEFKSKMDMKMETNMNFTLKATMNAKLEGSIAFEAKGGATAKLEGSAMTTVKGGMVMIN